MIVVPFAAFPLLPNLLPADSTLLIAFACILDEFISMACWPHFTNARRLENLWSIPNSICASAYTVLYCTVGHASVFRSVPLLSGPGGPALQVHLRRLSQVIVGVGFDVCVCVCVCVCLYVCLSVCLCLCLCVVGWVESAG